VANPIGAMSDRRCLAIPERDLLWLIPEIVEMKRTGDGEPHIRPSDNLGYYGIHEPALRDPGSVIPFWLGCRAGCQVVGIRSNGDVTGCLSLPSYGGADGDNVEGNTRARSLRDIWTRPDAFPHTRRLEVSDPNGICKGCRFGDLCRAGCPQAAIARTGSRWDNPLCFYRQAVEHGRWDLIADGEVDRTAGCSLTVTF
jgi:radical SAM protein with 4Fe4S-binding SPASM domain